VIAFEEMGAIALQTVKVHGLSPYHENCRLPRIVLSTLDSINSTNLRHENRFAGRNMNNHTSDFEISFPTLVDLLEWRASNHPDRLAYCYLPNGQTEGTHLTYGNLIKARAIAAVLQQQVQPGDRALLLYPPGQDFIIAFVGCLYAGVSRCPFHRVLASMICLRAIAVDAQAAVALTTSSVQTGLDHHSHVHWDWRKCFIGD
jgi:non-ribosomal peptide synthetase component F